MSDYAELVPERFPINDEEALRPDTVHFLRSSGSLASTTHVFSVADENSILPLLAVHDFVVTPDFQQAVEHVVKTGNATEIYTLSKAAFYSTALHLRAYTSPASAAPLASISRSLLSLGKQTMNFPPDSPHSDHPISIAAVGVGRRSQMFVKDSVPYFWDIDGGTHGLLYKVSDGKRVRIGEFLVHHSFGKDCVFALDSRALSGVVGLLSCVAMLRRIDSF